MGANCLGGFLYQGVFCFGRAFVLGGFLMGGFSLGGFVWGLFTGGIRPVTHRGYTSTCLGGLERHGIH